MDFINTLLVRLSAWCQTEVIPAHIKNLFVCLHNGLGLFSRRLFGALSL